MLMLDEAVLLAISTIRGVHNFFSRLRNLKDDRGDAVFNTVDFRVECKRPECEGRSDNCPHILAQLPSHLSADKAERVKLLMSGENDLYLQEIQNIETDPTEPMFQRHDIDWLFDPANEMKDTAMKVPQYLVTCVDPNGGGLSNYAIVSAAVYEDGTIAIVGIEEKNTKVPEEQRAIFIQHLKALKSRPEFITCPVVIGVESNLGFEANHHERYLYQEDEGSNRDLKLLDLCCVLHESSRSDRSERQVGLQASNAAKHEIAMMTRWNLSQHRYRFLGHNTPITCVSDSPQKVKTELQEQLYVFCRIVQPSPQLGGKPKIIYSGKQTRSHDDLSMAFQWITKSMLAFTSPQGRVSYQRHHQMIVHTGRS